MKRILPVIAAFLLLLSCYPPPFNPELSRTAWAAAKLTREATVGTSQRAGSLEGYGAVFFPEKTPFGTITNIDCTKGFVYITSQQGTGVLYTFLGSQSYESYGTSVGNPPPEPGLPPMTPFALKSGDAAGLLLIDPTNPGGSKIMVFAPNPGTKSLDATALSQPMEPFLAGGGITGVSNILGATVTSSGDPDDDLFILFRDTSGKYGEAWSSSFTSSNLQAPSYFHLTGVFPLPIPGSVKKCLYYHHPGNGASYASWYADGKWNTCTWIGSAAPIARMLPGVTHRIDAVISNNELFSLEDGTGRVFLTDGDGSLEYEFPLGDLRFAYMGYADNVPRMYFSQAYVAEETLRLMVFSIPAADLATLGAP